RSAKPASTSPTSTSAARRSARSPSRCWPSTSPPRPRSSISSVPPMASRRSPPSAADCAGSGLALGLGEAVGLGGGGIDVAAVGLGAVVGEHARQVEQLAGELPLHRMGGGADPVDRLDPGGQRCRLPRSRRLLGGGLLGSRLG